MYMHVFVSQAKINYIFTASPLPGNAVILLNVCKYNNFISRAHQEK